jgi:CubicO group peptidase (beta-lactamase class C family)
MRTKAPWLLVLALPTAALAQASAAAPPKLPKDAPRIVATYAAKVAASARFVSGRTIASVEREELGGADPVQRPLQSLARMFLSWSVDEDQKTVTARVLGAEATAAFVEGLGVTIVHGSAAELRARALPPRQPSPDPRDWPLGDAMPNAPLDPGLDLARLDEAMAEAFGAGKDGRPLHTRAVVVVHRGRLLRERYGDGYTPWTLLPGWSMTKSWVHALVGMRIQDGALDLLAPPPVPEWSDPEDPRRQIRLMDLLRMESGLAWTEDYDDPNSDALKMLFLRPDCGGAAAEKALGAPPGAVHQYSSGTSNLLCRILRASFADETQALAFAQRRLFAPLRMQGALLEPDASGVYVGSSFGFATARDWAKFGLLYLQDGVWDGERLLPAGWVARGIEPCASSPRGDYGAHIWLNRGRRDAPEDRPFRTLPQDLFYLSGFEGQYVVCFPSQELVVVRLGCTPGGVFDLHGFLRKVLRACAGDGSIERGRKR